MNEHNTTTANITVCKIQLPDVVDVMGVIAMAAGGFLQVGYFSGGFPTSDSFLFKASFLALVRAGATK
jgi:hypothetical protein